MIINYDLLNNTQKIEVKDTMIKELNSLIEETNKINNNIINNLKAEKQKQMEIFDNYKKEMNEY